jgi:propanol-preferring alcohol dehydrogenase
MKAMVLEKQGERLIESDLPDPVPAKGQLLIKIHACGVCRTDLHVVDGDLTEPSLPLIPGHQIVGTVSDSNMASGRFNVGDRIGIPWLGGSCGNCRYCESDRENLCEQAKYTGYQINGGFAEFCVADERFCFPIPKEYPDLQAAPLLCAGLIGYRAYRLTGNAEHLGFYGFGAAAHILIQLARYENRKVYVFTREGDIESQEYAGQLGAQWMGVSGTTPSRELDAAVIFAPAGELLPMALKAIARGGTVVCAGIHMSDIPSMPYSLIWGERVIRSVANLTRKDGEEFLAIAPKVPIRTEVNIYNLSDVNTALDDLRNGRFNGAAVIAVNLDDKSD